ncbi:glycosyltransferase [Ferrovibrio sp.]|uniref:glycosyltransferase n=1 Tax=Ferrovibrio sp. TaxID=1917215 RepID=UPI001B544C78|nr:glycosyltransferase [Ferrovibrio sp.]MBP7063424.1 glycosyltransferase [Ferrovibrio sp.]
MKILLIAFAFPPYNASGAVRAGMLAEYLHDRGHDVRVLTASEIGYAKTMTSRFPTEQVITTNWINVFALYQKLRQDNGVADSGSQNIAQPQRRGRWRQWLIDLAKGIIGFPDGQIGWYPAAVAAGKRLLQNWQPDLIYSTALPFTDHLIGRRLSQMAKVPWIAEYRDLFTENPYGNTPDWRLGIDTLIERWVLRPALACVSVSQPLADSLQRRYGKRTAVILNGYDPAGYAAVTPTPELDSATLSILYTGIIYPGRRDPTNLFAALALLGPERAGITVYFYGQDLRGVAEAAAHHGVSDCVRIQRPVSLRQSQSLQANADILLLLLWNDPREHGVFTGKLFEYAGAGRPILTLGCEDGVAADLIRNRGLGKVLNDPAAIAEQLRLWLNEKRGGGIAAPPQTAKTGLSRAEQFAALEDFIGSIGIR